MWCGFGKSSVTVAATCFVTAGLVISDTALAQRQRIYTPQQFRSVLRGLGYSVKVSNTPLTDTETRNAIREFQKGYKLQPVDGVAGPKTQNFAANIVKILQANFNLVLKPNPPLPRDQFYGPRTETTVRQFQKKFQLQETGIADLAIRQRLDQEAKNILKKPTSAPTTTQPSPKPTASPTSTPETSPTSTPTPTSTSTPEMSPTSTPEASPTSTPEASPTATPTSEASPTATPTSTP